VTESGREIRRRFLASAAGFTVPEVMVAVGILAVTVGLIGSGVFQVLSIQRFWEDDVIATKELRRAGSWFSSDALNAEVTDLVDGAPPVSGVTLSWTDTDGVDHTASYSLVGDTLLRVFDGTAITAGRRVVSASFSLSEKLITLELEVQSDRGSTESMSLQTYLRQLQ
jgi:hypothetical protein